jgi:hypothetical protein
LIIHKSISTFYFTNIVKCTEGEKRLALEAPAIKVIAMLQKIEINLLYQSILSPHSHQPLKQMFLTNA